MLNMRVARLMDEEIRKRPSYWNKETIMKWLADQGFDLKRDIAKGRNWRTKSFHFVQSVEE